MKVNSMKADLGGILVRVRHSEFTSKQVPKVVDVSYVCNLPATLKNLKPKSEVRNPAGGRVKGECKMNPSRLRNSAGWGILLERSSHLLSPLENPAGLNTLEVFHK